MFYYRLVKKLLKFFGFIGLCFLAVILATMFTVITRELGLPPIIVVVAQWTPLVGLFLVGKKMYGKPHVAESTPPKNQPLV